MQGGRGDEHEKNERGGFAMMTEEEVPFGEAGERGIPVGPPGGTAAYYLAPGGLFDKHIASFEFEQTRWAALVFDVTPPPEKKKHFWSKRPPNPKPTSRNFPAQFGNMRITTKDGFTSRQTGVQVDDAVRFAIEAAGLMNKQCKVFTRDLDKGQLEGGLVGSPTP